MAMKSCLLMALVLTAGLLTAADPTGADVDIWIENASSETRVKALVVAAWRTPDREGGVLGWSLGVCHDPDKASIGDCHEDPGELPCGPERTCQHIRCMDDLLSAGPNGQAPEFHGLTVYKNGVTHSVIMAMQQTWELEATDRFEIMEITYTMKSDARSVQVEPCDTLGYPSVPTYWVWTDGITVPPQKREGASVGLPEINIPHVDFIRGDANQDGRLSISDAICLAGAIFGRGQRRDLISHCMKSADANDDGKLDMADPINLLDALFEGGPAMPDPVACGQDPTDDDLTCDEYICR